MTASFTLYGTPTSGPVYKAALALSLLGQAYEFRAINLARREQKTPAYLEINRFGQVPALVIDNGPILVQSAAILEYLADQSGKLRGVDDAERQAIREWLYWDADKLSPGIYRIRALKAGRLTLEPPVAAYFTAVAEDALSVLQQHLDGRTWLVGEAPSIADIAVYGAVGLAPQGGFDLSRWPAVEAFRQRFEALPGWRPQAELAAA